MRSCSNNKFQAFFKQRSAHWIAASFVALCAPAGAAPAPSDTRAEGVQFICSQEKLGALESGMSAYLDELGIGSGLVEKSVDRPAWTVTYTLRTAAADTDTLYLRFRPEFGISDEKIQLPASGGKTRTVTTVSKKEIVLALFQKGRTTTFSGAACDIAEFRDHVGIRQNTVAWAEELSWKWPDGGPAKWNTRYWSAGTPVEGASLPQAFLDAFINQDKYEIGCYTATKLAMVHGVLDYYSRVKNDPEKLRVVEQMLLADNDPLVHVEPGKMWNFEADYDPAEDQRAGKLLKLQEGVAAGNFVPGDWAYLLNTDPVTYEKTGYEGSNAIYLGRNRFDDYYNDHGHSYSFRKKIREVYQWRHKVFSRTRDADKAVALSSDDYSRLSRTPAEGGLLLDLRAVPYLFGAEGGGRRPAP
ncbi:hypothetical protein D3C71_21910 [compost metagenome]